MAVAKTDYGNWSTLTGTLAEVAGALNTNNVIKEQVVGAFYDNENDIYVVIYARN